jgi:malonyl-CoA/methylmalonyl-CoA synthetase
VSIGERPAWTRHLSDGDAASVDLLARTSLPAAWTSNWRNAPERPVLRDRDGPWLTGADLLERTETLAGRLAHAGLAPGDRVILSGGITCDVAVAHCAAFRAGLVVVPVNPAFSQREVDALVAAARPAAAIVGSPEMRGWVSASSPDTVVTGLDVDLPDGPPPELDHVTSEDPALLLFTSGTTGTPKGVLLSHGNLLAGVEAVELAWRWTPDDRLILCLPLFHMHGLGVGLHGTLLAGASAIVHPEFDVGAVLRAAADDATMFFGVPPMYSRLLVADGAERLAHLRLCVSGSAPLSADVHRDIEQRCGQVILERYGMTETVMLVSNPYDGERRPGTVGFPLPGVDVRLAAGTDEIEVRGPNVFSGYLERPEANAEAFTSDGWFRTGDIGSIDSDGYLSIVGRAKELIITGGYNVYPREIEDVLRAHPTVNDCAVVGTPSSEWGETVTAYVVATDDFDADTLVAWAATQLAPYKKPRLVYRVDALPRNKLGKVQRDQLKPPDGD